MFNQVAVGASVNKKMVLTNAVLYMVCVLVIKRVASNNYIFNESSVLVAEAQLLCNSTYGTSLATITSAGDSALFKASFFDQGGPDFTWSLDSEQRNVWIGLVEVDSQWQWEDGTGLIDDIYTNWWSNNPNGYECAFWQTYTYTYEWNDVPCTYSTVARYACNYPSYSFHYAGKLSYNEAESYCNANYNSSLARINNLDSMNYLTNLAQDRLGTDNEYDILVGLYDKSIDYDDENDFGCDDTTIEFDWKWTNTFGKPDYIDSDYFIWDTSSNQPDSFTCQRKRCVTFSTQTGLWKNVNCSEKFYFICNVDTVLIELDTDAPTEFPTIAPSRFPTTIPTVNPSNYPSLNPTVKPTSYPTYINATTDCYGEYSCSDIYYDKIATIDNSINCFGYSSCRNVDLIYLASNYYNDSYFNDTSSVNGSSISTIGSINNNNINCDGSYSCYFVENLISSGYTNGINCGGLKSCALISNMIVLAKDSENVAVINCNGEKSCLQSQISIESVGQNSKIICGGTQSCKNSEIFSDNYVGVFGYLGLQNAILHSNGTSGNNVNKHNVSFQKFEIGMV